MSRFVRFCLYVFALVTTSLTCLAANHILLMRFGPVRANLYISNANGSGVHPLTKAGTFAYDPSWSPRGNLIEVTRKVKGSFNIFTIHPDGTGLKQLTHTRGDDAHAAWSPDGKWIVFASSRMGFKDEITLTNAPQPYGEVFVMRYNGTHVEQLTDDQWEEGGPAWQPERSVLAAAAAPSQ